MASKHNPKARDQELVVQNVNGELFIYDLTTDKVYSLNSTAAYVWNNLDGKTSIAELARRTAQEFNQPVKEDLIRLAIDGLRSSNPIAEETAPKPMSKLKRREAIKRIGLATMIALPMISMLVAPTALNAASGGTTAVCQPCTTNAQCAAPATCKPNYAGGSKICAVNTATGAFPTGFDIGAYSASNCNTRGAKYCCKGTATFTAPTTCVCK